MVTLNKHILFYDHQYFCEGFGIDTRVKSRFVIESLEKEPIPGVEVVAPTPATYGDLVSVHDPAYVEAILIGSPRTIADKNGLGTWIPDLATSVVSSTGGLICAVERALAMRTNTGSASSGLHHARFDHGNGFCTINGLVVGAKKALNLGARRVLILDLDAHCGGGTASLIDGVEGLEQVDVSVSSFDTYRPTSNSRLIMSTGGTYLGDIRLALHGIGNPQTIDLLIYNAGMDPHEHCRIGGVAGITTEILKEREKTVFFWARELGIPVVYAFAGGYEGDRLTREGLVDLHRSTIEAGASPNSLQTNATRLH